MGIEQSAIRTSRSDIPGTQSDCTHGQMLLEYEGTWFPFYWSNSCGQSWDVKSSRTLVDRSLISPLRVLNLVTRTLLSHFSCKSMENDLPIERHKGFRAMENTEESQEHTVFQWTLFVHRNYCAFLQLSALPTSAHGKAVPEHSSALQLSLPWNIRTLAKTTKSSTSPSKQCQQLIEEKKNSSDGSVKRQKPPRTVLRTSLHSQTTQSRITVVCKKALEPIQPSKISGIV